VIGALDTPLLSVNCFILGDDQDPDRVLVIKTRAAETVSELKDLIKEKRSVQLSNADASDLELWKASFPADDLATTQPSTRGPKLGSLRLLSDVFPSELNVNHVHVLVRVPGKGEHY